MADQRTGKCLNCGNEFTTQKAETVYCSSRCRSAAHRNRQAAELSQARLLATNLATAPDSPRSGRSWLITGILVVSLALLCGYRWGSLNPEKETVSRAYRDTTRNLRITLSAQQVTINQLAKTIATHVNNADSAEAVRPELLKAIDELPADQLQQYLDSLFEAPGPGAFTPVDPERYRSRAGTH